MLRTKVAVILLSLVFAGKSSAAKWEKLETQASIFADLSAEFVLDVFVMKSKKPEEKFINSLKQMTYISRAEFSMYNIPDEVHILPTTAAFDFLSSIRDEPGLADALEIMKVYSASKPHWEIFEGSDYNSDGGCYNIYLFDPPSSQAALISLACISD